MSSMLICFTKIKSRAGPMVLSHDRRHYFTWSAECSLTQHQVWRLYVQTGMRSSQINYHVAWTTIQSTELEAKVICNYCHYGSGRVDVGCWLEGVMIVMISEHIDAKLNSVIVKSSHIIYLI